jgi:serine/threonine-protein kinase RsbW
MGIAIPLTDCRRTGGTAESGRNLHCAERVPAVCGPFDNRGARAKRVSTWLGREQSRSMGSLRRSLPPAQAIELRRWTLKAGGELRQMRADLREVLRTHRLADHSASQVAERAVLVVTELASNALRHGRPPAVVRLLRADGCFIVDVADQDRENVPEPATGGHTDDGGRGLLIARSMAGEVCWYTTEDAKHIWASFLTEPAVDRDGHGEG